MFHNKYSVAQSFQRFQRRQQPPVIAMVQSDRRLVQHIQHPAQFGTNLRGQPNSLPFAAGKRCGRPVQRNIVQAHGVEKFQAFDDLMHHAPSNLLRTIFEDNSSSRH